MMVRPVVWSSGRALKSGLTQVVVEVLLELQEQWPVGVLSLLLSQLLDPQGGGEDLLLPPCHHLLPRAYEKDKDATTALVLGYITRLQDQRRILPAFGRLVRLWSPSSPDGSTRWGGLSGTVVCPPLAIPATAHMLRVLILRDQGKSMARCN